MTGKGRQPSGPTHCKHPIDVGICAAYVRAGSPHPGVCDQHVKEES
jgi:hypothetical protein